MLVLVLRRYMIGLMTLFIAAHIATTQVVVAGVRQPLRLDKLVSEFPPTLRAIDVGIMQWRDSSQLLCHYRLTAGMAGSREQAEAGQIMSRAELKEVYGDVLKGTAYPQVGTGIVAKNGSAFRYSLRCSAKLFGVSPFDCGAANGVTVHAWQFYRASDGKISGGSVYFEDGRDKGEKGRTPNPATPIDMPLFGFNPNLGKFFESEIKKGGGLRTQRFLWGTTRTEDGRLIVVEERWTRPNGGEGRLLQHREVTIRVDGKYPVVEKVEYWFPDKKGKMSLGSSVYASGFKNIGRGCLFPTKVITVIPAGAAPMSRRSDSKGSSPWLVRIWEAKDVARTKPKAAHFRIPLSPGMIVRGYAWPAKRMDVDLKNLDTKLLKPAARTQLPGKPSVNEERLAMTNGGQDLFGASSLDVETTKSGIARQRNGESSLSMRRLILVATAVFGVALMAFAAYGARFGASRQGRATDRGKGVTEDV